METADYRATAQDINKRIQNGRDYPFHGRAPEEYGQLISSLVHLIHGDELQYLGSSFFENDNENERHGDILAFTNRLVIRASITGGESSWADGTFTAEAFARADLTHMSVMSRHATFNREMSPWPGRYSVALTYRSGVEVHLPASRYPVGTESEDLDRLVPTLRADLAHMGSPQRA
ncbi:hypothetical protein [Georgenia sp. H159]|uniref:hypothetical protein n=1 Tax=Georgenia sp. H159 TaxID=3076115 RepID=UPI002D7843E0|nr:hypothetical protein [Georgenia sp. H159]